VTLGGTLVASLLVALSRPSTWPLALAGFLLRGGILLVVAPIVVLPTAVGLANILAPVLEDIAFGRRPAELAMVIGWAVIGLATWLFGGGLLAATAEVDLIRRVAEDDELVAAGHVAPRRSGRRPRQARRILAVRLLASIPLVFALVWGLVRVVAVAYRELTVPSDTDVPMVVRVVIGAPEAVAAIALMWLAGEIVGAMAARRIVLLEEGVFQALRSAVRRLVRQPLRCAALGGLPLLQLILIVAAMALAGSLAWDALRAALGLDDGSLLPWALLVAFVALFGAGLVLIAVTSAWRSAVWTVDLAGTFGVPMDAPFGEWNPSATSATLAALRPRGADQDRGDG
jgi:hypothetical protein